MGGYTLGICEWSYPVTGPGGLRQMKKYGIDAVQLDLGPVENGLPLSVPEIQELYLQAAEESGVKLHSVACSDLGLYGMTNPKASEKGGIARRIIQAGISAAAGLGLPMVMLTNFRDGLIRDEEGFSNTAETIRWACSAAKEKGIAIASENALSWEDNLRLLEAVGADNLGLCFDTQNPYLRWGYYVPDMIRKLKDHILFIHVKDGSHGNISSELLGDGDTSFLESVKAIKEIGYEGDIILENLYSKRPLSLKNANPYRLLEEDVRRFWSAFGEESEVLG